MCNIQLTLLGLSSGHIPNSLSLPFPSYLEQSSNKVPYSLLKPTEELRSTLVKAVGGEDKWAALGDKPVVFTCGSGMTAAVGWLADTLVRESEGKEPRGALYDEVSPLHSIMKRMVSKRLIEHRAGQVGQVGKKARLNEAVPSRHSRAQTWNRIVNQIHKHMHLHIPSTESCVDPQYYFMLLCDELCSKMHIQTVRWTDSSLHSPSP